MEKPSNIDYSIFHSEIALELGISVEDVRAFRSWHLGLGLNIAQIVERIEKRLPNLIASDSWRIEPYKFRLKWIKAASTQQWETLMKEYHND